MIRKYAKLKESKVKKLISFPKILGFGLFKSLPVFFIFQGCIWKGKEKQRE